jgi:Flp pilus assembly protein TadG
MKAGRTARSDRGAAAVEFALVLPVLLLVIFGIIDFGRMLYTKITLTQAAQAAARATAVLGKDDGELEATKAAGGLDQSDGALTVVATPCPSPPDQTANAQVSLTYRFTFITPLAALADIGGGSIELHATSYSPCVG